MLDVQTLPIEDIYLHPDSKPSRKVPAITDSLISNKCYVPLVVSSRNMTVLKGNQVLRALKDLGYKNVSVILVDDLSIETEKKIFKNDKKTFLMFDYVTMETLLLFAELESMLAFETSSPAHYE